MGLIILAASCIAAAIFTGFVFLNKKRLGLSLLQSVAFSVLRALFRIRIKGLEHLAETDGARVFVLMRQSALDAMIMTALLPRDCEHFYGEGDDRRRLLAPFRRLGRASGNIGLTARARLSAALLRDGVACLYVGKDMEPSPLAMQEFSEIAGVVRDAKASIVPVYLRGSRHSLLSAWEPAKAPRHLLPQITVAAAEPFTITSGHAGQMADQIYDGLALAKFRSTNFDASIFEAIAHACRLYGPGRAILEDALGGKLTYRRLMIGARVFAGRISALSQPDEALGVLLPNANGVVVTLFALFSAGRPAAMLNYTAGPAAIVSAIKTGRLQSVLCSRGFVEKAELHSLIAAIEANGTRIVYIEDIRDAVRPIEKLKGALLWRQAVHRRRSSDPAVILFTSGSEGTPKGVVLSSANLLANASQADCRIDISPSDVLFNVLPVFHTFGLLGGTLLPLLYGIRLFLYPSPLHYKLIPAVARKIKPSIMFGTDTFLAGYGRAAKDGDFDSLRLIVSGAEPVRSETRKIFRERFGAEIVEGYGMTEASPVVAVNSSTHGREGSVGRAMADMKLRLEPVEGIEEGGRMHIAGPNLMLGYMTADQPGVLQPLGDGWHDSGDIVSIDAQGYISIRGRAKRFAKIAGEMVSLGAVELMVQQLWPEAQHAVITLPDRRKGERIVLVTTKMPALKDELQAHSRRFGATELMVPNDIVTVDSIPVLGSGKTDYQTTRTLVESRLVVVDPTK